MKSHQLFSSSNSGRVTIYPADIKQCLDKYKSIKKSSILHPTSEFMKKFQLFYDSLTPPNTLTFAQLHSLAYQLYSLKYISYPEGMSENTYRACADLYKKMGVLVEYGRAFPQVFNQLVYRPQLDDYITSIKKRMPGIDITLLIINYPGALEYIAKSKQITETMLNVDYCGKVKDYELLVPACHAVDRLRHENRVLYNNLKEEKTCHVLVSNEYVRVYGFMEPKTTTTTSSVVHDLSKNPYYKAKLDSRENIDFIFKHAEHAHLIADVLVRLHEGMIGKAYQEQAEAYMAAMMDKTPEVFIKFSNAFLSDSSVFLDQFKRTLKMAEFNEIIQRTIKVSLDEPPSYIPSSRQKMGK